MRGGFGSDLGEVEERALLVEGRGVRMVVGAYWWVVGSYQFCDEEGRTLEREEQERWSSFHALMPPLGAHRIRSRSEFRRGRGL